VVAGNKNGQIRISSNQAQNSPYYVDVTFAVAPPPPTFGLDPEMLSFEALQGGGIPDSQTINITNMGGEAPYDTGKLINTSSGAYLTTGGAWTDASDRNLKENFTTVNTAELLAKLKSLEISQWNYKSENADIKHIGPVAQDFYAAFGVGNDNKSISTIDPAGIALATIQELEKRTSRLQMENDYLKEKIVLLEQNMRNMQSLLNRRTEK